MGTGRTDPARGRNHRPGHVAGQGHLVPGHQSAPTADPHDTPDGPHQAADLTEVVRLYGIRNWIEQSYKPVKDELGWVDFQVHSATAIRRHQTLVNCAFSFCWNTWFAQPSTSDSPGEPSPAPPTDDSGEEGRPTQKASSTAMLAQGAARSPCLAHPMATPTTLVESLVTHAPTG
jgi:hypothetical protein